MGAAATAACGPGEECADMAPDMSSDETREFLENLPELGQEDRFCFDCNPGVPCFNQCCAELTLPLTPFDVLRLRRNLGMTAEEFLHLHSTMSNYPDTGFPMPMLRMLEGPGEPCPFVSQAGCTVYEDRPGACRCYPLGRGTRLTDNGVAEKFFMVREPHCHGFDKGTDRTPAEWFADQELVEYNLANDRYMRLMAMVKATGKPLDQRMANMVLLCLFQVDKFRELIGKMRIFSRVELDAARQDAIMADSLEGDKVALEFALDWVELVLFGKSAGLEKKA